MDAQCVRCLSDEPCRCRKVTRAAHTFFRLGMLLKLPLHAVFVFDGLWHLPDKGRKVRSSPHWLTHDFQRMLELFGFHWTEAPSEGEAELAAMNTHGVIDAVMTEDSDTLIFGAPCIIRRYASAFLAKKDKDYLNVQVYTEDGLEHGCSLTRGDRLLIALLTGGDYDGGVPGCGIKIAHKVAQHSKIGQMMLDAFLSLTPDEFSKWAKELIEDLRLLLTCDPHNFLERRYKAVADRILHNFPQHALLGKYVHPLTSFSATGSGTTMLPPDVLSHQQDLASLADFCCQNFSWDDDAIIEKMYGSVWEGAYLRTLCKVGSMVFVGSC
ncbi:PIN domain-like protein [Suillus subluteus]|nr:PIN domain-like protein [Suillus subluteus]